MATQGINDDGSGGPVDPVVPATAQNTQQANVGVNVAGKPGTGSGGNDALNETGDDVRDAQYWAQNNPQGVDQSVGGGVYWTKPDGSNDQLPAPLGTKFPDQVFYQTRQFDSGILPTAGTWADGSILNVLQEPTSDVQGSAVLSNAKAALQIARNRAIVAAGGTVSATPAAVAVVPTVPLTVQQSRTYLDNSPAGRWNGSQSPLADVSANVIPTSGATASYAKSATAMLGLAQANGNPNITAGEAGTPAGLLNPNVAVGGLGQIAGVAPLTGAAATANATAIAASPVLARANRAYDPVRYFYDRASNGSVMAAGKNIGSIAVSATGTVTVTNMPNAITGADTGQGTVG